MNEIWLCKQNLNLFNSEKMVEIIEEPDGDVIEDVDSDDLEQFYDALESKIDEDSDRPIEVKWDEMMKNLDVKIEKANHAKLKGTEFFKMGNLAQVGVEYFVLKANLTKGI